MGLGGRGAAAGGAHAELLVDGLELRITRSVGDCYEYSYVPPPSMYIQDRTTSTYSNTELVEGKYRPNVLHSYLRQGAGLARSPAGPMLHVRDFIGHSTHINPVR